MREFLKFGLLFCLSMVSFVSISCTRKANTQSQISIKVPDQAELNKASSKVSMLVSDGMKLCFAVNVIGEGIDQNAICGQKTGIMTGFVDEGQTLTVTVPKGNRSFYLLSAIVETNKNCPSQDDVQINQALWEKIYLAGSARNVTLDSEEKTIEIPVELESNSIGATSGISECGNQPGIIRAALLSSGDIVNEKFEPLAVDDSFPIWDSLTYGLGLNGAWSWSFMTSSEAVAAREDSEITPTFADFTVSPHVRSVTQKPGTREFYGLYQDGQIVSVDPNTGDVTESSSCSLDVCQVPVWIQSISVGTNQRVFALDHGGNIYQVKNSNGVQELTYLRSVSPIVSQIVFY